MVDIKIISESALLQQYNEVCKKHLALKSVLSDLSDNDLYVYLAGRTYEFGRAWKDSIENAEIHLGNRKKAERMFSKREGDLGK